jgi:integrase
MKSGSVVDISPLLSWIRTNLNDPSDFSMLRNKTVLLLAMATMARPVDLAILKRSSITFIEDYMKLTILGAKNDRSFKGILKHIRPSSCPDLCPVLSMRKWLEFVDPRPDAPLFYVKGQKLKPLSVDYLSSILRDSAKEAGIDCMAKDFRTTMTTRAAKAGMEPYQIMALGGWRNFDTVCRHYIRWNPSTDATDVLFGIKHLPDQPETSSLEVQSDEEEEGEGDELPIQVLSYE